MSSADNDPTSRKEPWDPKKSERNRRKHGIDFEAVRRLDWLQVTFDVDERKNYGETRVVAMGPIDGRLHVLVYTERDGGVRVISLRKANEREQRRWAARRS
jgi:uncharacterized DUF497 family protein